MRKKKTILTVAILLIVLGMIPLRIRSAPTGNSWGEDLTSNLPFDKPRKVDRDSAGRVFVANHTGGVYRSTDQGVTWTEVLDTGGYQCFSMYVDSRDYIFCQVSDSKVYRSIDNGDSFQEVAHLTDVGLTWYWDESSNGTLYFNNYDVPSPDIIYSSVDEGATWDVFYNVTASSNPVRHIHSVDVAPNDYVFVTTGDQDVGANDNTIRRFNGTDWENIAVSTSATDTDPRVISIWFMDGYAYTAPDASTYMYRFNYTENNSTAWLNRERILLRASINTGEIYDSILIDGCVFLSTDHGWVLGSWDSERFVKVFSMSSGAIVRFSSPKSFPLYFIDWENDKLYRLNQMTKADLIHLFYNVYNVERGGVQNQASYILDQPITNGTNYLDLTTVALSNVEASIKGLSKRNSLVNSGFEYGNTSSWTIWGGGDQLSVSDVDKNEGTYSLKAIKTEGEGNTLISQTFTYNPDRNITFSWYWKSNDTIASALAVMYRNKTDGYSQLASNAFDSTTTWTRYERTLGWNSGSFEIDVAFYFYPKNCTTYFDSILVHESQVVASSISTEDNAIYFESLNLGEPYFSGTVNTLNPTLTVNGETVSHSGTLTNGTESSATSLSGILTGGITVSANIEGSGQAILKVTGTREVYEDSIILTGRSNNIYYGRYYGTFTSLTGSTDDVLAVSDVASEITAISYSEGYKLDLTIDSEISSTTKVYCGRNGKPQKVIGATDWTYDHANKLITISITHSSPKTVSIIWGTGASSSFSLRVHVSKNTFPFMGAIVDVDGENKSTDLFGDARFDVGVGSHDVTVYLEDQNETRTIFISRDQSVGFDFEVHIPQDRGIYIFLALPIGLVLVIFIGILLWRRQQ